MENQDKTFISFSFSSSISRFSSFHRISPCITQLEEQWQDLDLTSWQIQGCRTMTPALWFNKPCHLHSPVQSLHKHLPQIDRLGESISSFSFLQFSGSSSCMHDQVLSSWFLRLWSLHLILPACDKDPLQYVWQTVGEWPGYYIYSQPGTLVQKGQTAVVADKSCFLFQSAYIESSCCF